MRTLVEVAGEAAGEAMVCVAAAAVMPCVELVAEVGLRRRRRIVQDRRTGRVRDGEGERCMLTKQPADRQGARQARRDAKWDSHDTHRPYRTASAQGQDE